MWTSKNDTTSKKGKKSVKFFTTKRTEYQLGADDAQCFESIVMRFDA